MPPTVAIEHMQKPNQPLYLTRRHSQEQLETLQQRVRPMLSYLGRLEKRMEIRGFNPDDRLLQLVRSAHDSLHRVSVELHYRACESARGEE